MIQGHNRKRPAPANQACDPLVLLGACYYLAGRSPERLVPPWESIMQDLGVLGPYSSPFKVPQAHQDRINYEYLLCSFSVLVLVNCKRNTVHLENSQQKIAVSKAKTLLLSPWTEILVPVCLIDF